MTEDEKRAAKQAFKQFNLMSQGRAPLADACACGAVAYAMEAPNRETPPRPICASCFARLAARGR